uniref:Uncharacterized protein n=1 Tax=Schistocephalus solidus TaxID=70667 RepID=A0A0X3PZK2_SCHSO
MKGKSDVKCAKIFRNPQLKNVSLAQLHLCTKRTEMQLSETTTQSHCAYIHVSSSPDEIFFELVWERTGRTRWHNAGRFDARQFIFNNREQGHPRLPGRAMDKQKAPIVPKTRLLSPHSCQICRTTVPLGSSLSLLSAVLYYVKIGYVPQTINFF